ncbi:unnamed protein product [marine sediment metagenome]|uniref:Uncharacterized protein n=1 Tax=marine sediment metagenome TaxID=412755 RepID=X1BEL4_9ZZZZ
MPYISKKNKFNFYVQVTHVYAVLTPQDGGFNNGTLEAGDAIIAIKNGKNM